MLIFDVSASHKLFKLCLELLSFRGNDLGPFLLVFLGGGNGLLLTAQLLFRGPVTTQVIVYHIGVDIRVGVETSAIGWVAQAGVNMLFFPFVIILEYLFAFFEFLCFLEVFGFYAFYSVLVCQLELI